MKARVDAATDVAMIGAWDARRGAVSLTPSDLKHLSDTLEADAAQGHLFLLHTGGDGGGPIDVYVDEAVPREVQERLVPSEGEFLLALPSGALVVGGVEDYRSPQARITDDHSTVTVPAGDYAVRCYAAKDEEQSPKSDSDLNELVGRADLEYYDRINRTGCIVGALTLLLFPILAFPLGWKLALPITVAVFVSFFPAWAWLLKRNARYQRLHRVVPVFRIQHQDPTFVLTLRTIHDRTGLKGGSLAQ